MVIQVIIRFIYYINFIDGIRNAVLNDFMNICKTVYGTLGEKCPNTIQSISLYSFRIRKKTDQKKLRIWTLFKQWQFHFSNNHRCSYICQICAQFDPDSVQLSFPPSWHGVLKVGIIASIKSLGTKNYIYIFYIPLITFIYLKMFVLIANGCLLIYHIRVFKNGFYQLLNNLQALTNLHYVIIQKTMSPRKSEKTLR